MEKETKKPSQKQLLTWGIVCAVSLFLIVLVSSIESLKIWFSGVLLIFRPILLGLALAYLCNPIFRLYERKVLFRLRPPAFRRAISLTLAYLTLFAIVFAILWLILPQLADSILAFAGNYQANLDAAIKVVNRHIGHLNSLLSGITGQGGFFAYISASNLQELLDNFLSSDIATYVTQLKAPVSGVISLITDLIFAIFISIYLLASKEKRYAQVMKLRHALFDHSTNAAITNFCTVADRSFGAFIEGKLLDSLIVGVLLWALLALFGVPYAVLLAAIIAIANIIPLIGPLLGAIPASIILLLSAPERFLPFLIAVLVIQQIDYNILSPKILGSNTGVSSLCVLIAIVTAGTVWGIPGMFFGVPLFATVLALSEATIVKRLQKKGIPSGLENYYDENAIIDPSKSVHTTTDKMAQGFERHALRIKKKLRDGEELSARDRAVLHIYKTLHKYHFITEMTEENQLRFTASEVIREAEKEARECFAAERVASSTDAPVEE